MSLFHFFLLIAAINSSILCYRCRGEMDKSFTRELDSIFTDYILRRVHVEDGANTIECLNAENLTEPPFCRTLQYAFHESENVSEIRTARNNLVIQLGPGVYSSLDKSTRIINSDRIAIIGAGISQTSVVCGENEPSNFTCNYLNFQIRNSSRVYVSGITFTGCGPVTSSLYVGLSNFIFIDECSFENNTSPAVLIYNTPNIRITNTSFLHNHPRILPIEIVHKECSTEDIFIDNRMASGGISLYIDDTTDNILIENCQFIDNFARNDSDVRYEKYGQGGALSLRFNSSTDGTVCIKGTEFVNNSAEVQAGAIAISLIKFTNKFIISDSIFEGNLCKTPKCTGGAVGINFFADTQINTILFVNCNFTGNSASSSGAIVLSTSVGAKQSDEAILKLENCWFRGNRAFFEGTALGVFSVSHTNELGIPVDINNCHFHENQGNEGSRDTTAITVYRVLLSFEGHNTFYKNVGGGTTLLTSQMDVRGSVTFDGNVAVFGAGVAMSGFSLILLHEDSSLLFANNFARELGAGLYVDYSSSNFIFTLLNTGCFIRHNSSNSTAVPPRSWKSTIEFINNTANIAGAAIYASDMSGCRWLGGLPGNHTIFQIDYSEGEGGRGYGFKFRNNTVTKRRSVNADQTLATNPLTITVTSVVDVSYGEKVLFTLNSKDELGNFREAVWSVDAPLISQRLGSISSNNAIFSYTIPKNSSQLLADDNVKIVNGTIYFNVNFFLLNNEGQTASMQLVLGNCHPGYNFKVESQTCTQIISSKIVRSDFNHRYFYTREGLWVEVDEDQSLHFVNTIPGFLNCTRLGTLPGCLFKYDNPNEQCASGRTGTLCGDCEKDYGVTFDLRFCRENCGFSGIFLFIFICILVPLLSLAILYFDFPIPNELKGVIFYAQVVGVIYRSTPYQVNSTSSYFFDYLINFLGFPMPFPVCFYKNAPVVLVAILGYVPPTLAILTAVAYWLCANYVKKLSNRENYGFHGFYLLLLFVYKYFVDTTFIFVSCTNLDGSLVFLYQGTQKCGDFPFILLVLMGSLLLVSFGVVLPVYVLKLIYEPKKMIQVRNALVHGLKDGRRYMWYGVWDIWRRLLFVGVNLCITVTTRSVVLFLHSLLILFCLWVLCFVKPYRRYYINLFEGLMILCLFATTLSIYDDNDLYIGKEVGRVFIALPFIYGALFIIYRILKAILCPIVEKKLDLDNSKLGPFKEKCMNIVNEVKGKTFSFTGEELSESSQAFGRKKSFSGLRLSQSEVASLEQSYAPELRESLLADT